MKIKLKKGSKIHIKDSQKGSFTKYCNGKVTEECIQKGKNSPDPKIRKKATFAANARKWNHKDGGEIPKGQLGLNLLFFSPSARDIVNRFQKTSSSLTDAAVKGIKKVGNFITDAAAFGANTDYGQTSPFVMQTSKERQNIMKGQDRARQLVSRKARRKVTEGALKGLEIAGKGFNTMLTSGASTDFGQTNPFAFPTSRQRTNIAKSREAVRKNAKKYIEKASPYLSPSNYAVALTQGRLDPKVGAQKLSEWGPEFQLAGTGVDYLVFAGPKGVRTAAVNTVRIPTGAILGGRILRDVYRNADRPFNFRNYKYLADPRFLQDLFRVGEPEIMRQRARGTYPLTYPERKAYVKSIKQDIPEGVRLALEDANKTLSPDIDLMFVNPEFRRSGSFDFATRSPKVLYGTRNAMNNYSYLNKNLYPEQAGYSAYYQPFWNKIYIPFRYKKNTLQTNPAMQTKPDRLGLGGHETRHSIQNRFKKDLDFTEDRVPGAYNRYTNYYDLPKNLVDAVDKYIDANGNYGKWAGSLGEMDAEMAGWRVKHGYPKLSKMNFEDLEYLKSLFRRRFGMQGNIDPIFKAMSEAGYWKKGGKLK